MSFSSPQLLEYRIARQSGLWVSAGSCCALGDPCWILAAGAPGWCWLLPNPTTVPALQNVSFLAFGISPSKSLSQKAAPGSNRNAASKNQEVFLGQKQPPLRCCRRCGHPGWGHLWSGFSLTLVWFLDPQRRCCCCAPCSNFTYQLQSQSLGC